MTLSIVKQASSDFNIVIGIASANLDGAVDIEVDDQGGASSATGTITISGDSSAGTRFELDNNDTADGTDLIVDMNGSLTVGAMSNGTDGGGQLLITALGAAGSVVSSTTFKISGDVRQGCWCWC